MLALLRAAQVILAIVITLTVLLQNATAELGGSFGGSGEVIRHTRRGAEKILFRATIVFAALFILVSIGALFFAA